MLNIMEIISDIDRKILYELIWDSRQTYKSIGKKIHQSKNVVNYRIKRLEKLGIIKNYFTIIDIYKLGYNGYRIYTNLQYCNPIFYQKIIKHFKNDENVGVLYNLLGEFELVVIFWVKEYQDFFKSWNKSLNLFSNYFQNPSLSILHQIFFYDPIYLLSTRNDTVKRKTREISVFNDRVQIDTIEFQILKVLSQNARMSTIDVAKTLDLSEEIVRYRIKKLIKTRVIKGFSTTIDISKINYEWAALNIFLKQYEDLKKINNYLLKNPNFIGLDMNTGYCHLQAEFHVKNAFHLREIIDDLMLAFPKSIRMYSSFKSLNVYKRQYFPI